MALFHSFQGNFDAFSFAVVFDPSGRPVPVSRFWNKNTAILVFLRHFGCIACRSHAIEIWSKRNELEKNGGRIIFIGSGEPSCIESFRADFGLAEAPIFTDPTLRAFELGGFRRGITRLVNGKSLSNAIALSREGHQNGSVFDTKTGSHLQMGGVIVVQAGPKVTYHYVSEALGDTPLASEIESTTNENPDSGAA